MLLKTFLLSFSFISLLAQNNPSLYSPLGNKLYDASSNFNIFIGYTPLSDDIRSYQTQCDALRNIGFELESKANITVKEKNDYLVSLRTMEQNYIRIIYDIQKILIKSINSNDYDTFQQIANAPIPDLWQSPSLTGRAIEYYQKHKEKGKILSLEELVKYQNIEKEFDPELKAISPSNYNGADYTKAVGLFNKACEEGYYRACTNLGHAYFRGKGVQQNSAMAVKYYLKACEGNDGSGCRNLGNAYYHGIGVQKDYEKAADIYTKACELGNSDGCINLGNLYYYGFGVSKDRDKAMQLYKKACNDGNNRGCSVLGSVYYIGKQQ